MKFVSVLIAACFFAVAKAHFGILLFDADGNNEAFESDVRHYCVPYEGNVTDREAWYSYNTPVANSFNALSNWTDRMANRTTVLSATTLGGHDELTEKSFGLVFGSVDPTSVAGTAVVTCYSPQWIGLKIDPVDVLDDPTDTSTWDHMSGSAHFEFSWEAGETDGFLVFDVLHMECTFGATTGIDDYIGLHDDDDEGDSGNTTTDPWTTTRVYSTEGSRVIISQSCTLSVEETNTTYATTVEFVSVDGVVADGTASGYVWYDEETYTLTWEIDFTGFTSQITGFELQYGGEAVVSLGSDDQYYFTPTGSVVLTEEQGEQLQAGDLSIVITTSAHTDGQLTASLELDTFDDIDEDPEDDGMNSASQSALSLVAAAAALSTTALSL